MYMDFDITALTGSDVTALTPKVVTTPAETSFRGDTRRYDLTANVMESGKEAQVKSGDESCLESGAEQRVENGARAESEREARVK